MSPTGDDRRRFLAERRAASRQRYDTRWSVGYDEEWGAISPTHRRFVDTFVGALPAGSTVFDAACGTGKYWPALLAAGVRPVGVDQSEGMLARAAAKHPEVVNRALGLQELVGEADWRGGFDGLLCVDALENVGPEDWPPVLAGFVHVLRPGATAYLTVELAEGPLPPGDDPRQVAGELTEGGGYHFYPPAGWVRAWLTEAGFRVVEEAEGDDYWHLLLRVGGSPGPGPGPDQSALRTRR